MAPFMLAIYLIITQVLLLNLLIAQFGVTFGEVREKAKEYQSWHRCQIVREFYNRQPLVPPFQILRCIRKVVKYVNNRHCPRRSSCCCCGNSQSKEEDRNKLVLKTSGYDTCVKLDWYTVQNGSGVEIGWDKEGRYKTHQLVILTMDENMHVMQQDCFTLAKLTPDPFSI
nr:hypothetical protein BaRGS_011823 [Batillaria attramentaria]